MIIIKTPLLMPDDQIVNELQKITKLIYECNNTAFIILFGSYAEMKFRSALGGYELLVLTNGTPLLSNRETYEYIEKHYPQEERIEKCLTIYTNSLQTANSEYTHNYFYHMIRNEGILLYNCGNQKLWRRDRFNSRLAYQRAQKDTETYLPLGKIFLQDAIQHFSVKEYRIATANIYLAASVLYFTVARLYYVYNTFEADNFHATYSLSRHVSAELGTLWKIKDDTDNKYSFNYLYSFNYRSRFKNEFTCPPEVIKIHLQKTQRLAEIVTDVCHKKIKALEELLN